MAIKLIVSGVLGRMGQAICAISSKSTAFSVVAGVDNAQADLPFPIYGTFAEIKEKADCIIDFSSPAMLAGLLEYALQAGTPAVIATTGFSDEEIQRIHKASSRVPLFYSANMSLGINLIAELCKIANAVLGSSFDIEIVEKHHNKKLDSPSGTALLLADEINSTAKEKYNYVFDRSAKRQARSQNEIGIHGVRGGNVVGEHEVHFFGSEETVTISHSALSREVFAEGALRAASFVKSMPAGLYSMKDIVKL